MCQLYNPLKARLNLKFSKYFHLKFVCAWTG